MSGYARGGYVPPPPGSGGVLAVLLADDECVWDNTGRCVRKDDAHHYTMLGTRRLCDPETKLVRGPCLHRHTVPVESCVTGQVLARLCLNCDRQLDAGAVDVSTREPFGGV